MPSLLWLVVPFITSRYLALHETLGAAYPLTICFAVGMWLVVYRYQSVRDRAIPFRMQTPDAADPSWESVVIENPSIESHLYDPRLMAPFQPQDRKYITCYDPATALHLNTVLADNQAEIEAKILRADEAQKVWKRTTLEARRKVIRSLKKWLVDNQETCARMACRDSGKTLIDASLGEVLTTAAKLDWIINHGTEALSPEHRQTSWMLSYKSSYVHYEPLGVVAAITSWNYPLHNSWSPIIASLFAGNAVVLKCSENVVWSTSWFVGAIRECLRVCGYSPELVQVVCCYPDEAQYLTKSPLIKHITFIGSETVGRIIARDATEQLTPVTLELGGKDPAIIMPSTDLNQYISLLLRGVYQNAGQNCVGIERIIVHTSQYEDLYRMFAERVQRMRVGAVMAQSPEGHLPIVDVGAMINKTRFEELSRVISAAGTGDGGASIEVGGEPYVHPYHPHGSYYVPTVVGDPAPDTAIAHTELFAPVATILTYETLEEAIDLANSTRYALGASVFGPDQDRCVQIAKRLECGMVSINDFGVYYLNQDLPFGGVKGSGYGRFGGPEGLRALTNPKAIIVDRFPWLIQTTIPKVLDYPIQSITHSWDFASGMVALFYADTWRGSFDGLLTILSATRH